MSAGNYDCKHLEMYDSYDDMMRRLRELYSDWVIYFGYYGYARKEFEKKKPEAVDDCDEFIWAVLYDDYIE